MIKESELMPLEDVRDHFIVVASRSHLSPETETYIADLKKKHGSVELISSGSSIKICLVAEGSADVYPRFAPTMEWDTAAGHAIARAAGMEVYQAGKEEPLLSKNMYWYWSTRGDLEGAVFTHVIDYLKKIDLIESKIPVQIIIRSYMKSDEFIQWLWSIDSNGDDKDLDEVKRNLDEIEITDNDNAFSDAWS